MNRRESLKTLGMGLIWKALPGLEQTPESRLQRYLRKIRKEQNRIEKIIAQEKLFVGIVSLSIEQQIEDFRMYFSMYKAGEIKYGVAWYLLWIIHEQETTASRNKYPETSGYKGAMQLHPRYYEFEEIASAGNGWEVLDNLDQRYSWKNGSKTTDWEEILRGAGYIRIIARQRYQSMDLEAGNLAVVKNNYSTNGQEQVKKYWDLKNLFYPSPTPSPSSTKSSS